MASDRIEFGSVLNKHGNDEKKLWAFIAVAVIAVVALVGWAVVQGSQAGTLRTQAESAQKQLAESQKAVEERDRLLVEARRDEGVQKSPGASVSIFFAADPKATASGVVFAHPDQHVARTYLYGLTEQGSTYVLAARKKDGSLAALGKVVPDDSGNGFLLARDVPEDATSIELLLKPAEPEATAQAADGKGASPGEAKQPPAEGKPAQASQDGAQARADGAQAKTDGAQAKTDGAQVKADGAQAKADGGAASQGTGSGQAEAGAGGQDAAAKDAKPAISLEGASPRIAARWPANGERGVLMQPPPAAGAPGRKARR